LAVVVGVMCVFGGWGCQGELLKSRHGGGAHANGTPPPLPSPLITSTTAAAARSRISGGAGTHCSRPQRACTAARRRRCPRARCTDGFVKGRRGCVLR
jgi:hypothetical protein